jgi:hypothetical protein
MSVLSGGAARSLQTGRSVRRFLEQVLDDMPLTERPYHHLNHSMPLVEDLVRRTLSRTAQGDRVLLVGGSALLGNALIRLGYDLEIWQFPNAADSEEMKEKITREVTPATLGETSMPEGEYRLVLLPFVLESLSGRLEEFLKRLRLALSQDGGIIVATKNQARLGTRLTALTGRRLQAASRRLSLSWPAVPVVREYHRDELIESSRKAGFRVDACDFVKGENLFMELDNLAIGPYAARKAGALVQGVLPASRDTIVMEISPRIPQRIAWRTADGPTVSVVVAAPRGGEQLRATFASLGSQTYRHPYEIIVLHDGERDDVIEAVADLKANSKAPVRDIITKRPEGPHARNLAAAAATGDILAHTDDTCEPPPDWLEGAVRQFDDDTGLVAGPIFAMPGSFPRFMEIPGLRPEPAEGEAWREDLFPVANVFYRTAVAIAAGGFSVSFEEDAGRAASGWDTDLAWRLRRNGWQARFREEVCMFRRFPAPEGPWALDQARKAADMPSLYRSVPEAAAGSPKFGPFASTQTMYFDLLAAGAAVALARRRWPWLLLALPWLSANSKRMDFWPPTAWNHSARMTAKLGLLHTAWLAGLLRGSLKTRRPLL